MNKLLEVSEKKVLRGYILQICYQAEPIGAGTAVIISALKQEGFAVTKADVTEACNYLMGKQLITVKEIKNEVLNISRDIAYITPVGVDVLEGTRAVEGVELVG